MKKVKGCESCGYRLPIGDGDHLCEVSDDPGAVVLVGYMPGPDYMICNGCDYEEGRVK